MQIVAILQQIQALLPENSEIIYIYSHPQLVESADVDPADIDSRLHILFAPILLF